MKRSLLKACTAWVAVGAILNPIGPFSAASAVTTAVSSEPALTPATSLGTTGAAQARDPRAQTPLTLQQKITLLQQKVKYVFVLFQENRSFDHYFGTYPGANGLFATYPGASSSNPYSQPATSFSSYHSVIQDTNGSFTTITPFLIPRTILNQPTPANPAGAEVQLFPEDTYSVDHSHSGYMNDFHFDKATESVTKNDGYPLDQQGLHYSTDASGVTAPIVTSSGVAPTSIPTLQTKQKAEVVISHVDCDTIPFLWQYADRFVLFDNFHQTATGPSTPNAIAMIGGQTGDTQWVKHPANANGAGTPYAGSLTLPNLTDSAPFPGSIDDTAAVPPSYQPPFGPDEATNPLSGVPRFLSGTPQVPLTFASLPLSFMGSSVGSIVRADQHLATDLVDVQHDILAIAAKNPSVGWGWYQQGYGPEPFDGKPISENAGSYHYTSAPEHASYIVHHNGPQYFGYIGDNTQEQAKMHGLQQFYTDVANQALPAAGGVFYVRGGYYNNDGLLPADTNPNVRASTPGNDDHPNYSDAQISEALIADSVNAIANSPYWSQSAIIITYDETDGLYDHQPEQFRTYGPDHLPETGGPRIPTIVISPFAAAHTVSHVYSEHSSVIKFINELFNLTPLADLPDEAAARAAGATNPAFNGPNGPQTNLGPADALATMGDLLEAFDNDRLSGNAPPLPASYATIDPTTVHTLPHYVSTLPDGSPQYGCQVLGISPTDYPSGYAIGGENDPPPDDFNPRPTQSPGAPYFNINNNTAPASPNTTPPNDTTAAAIKASTGAWPN
jgi:phospholipase C